MRHADDEERDEESGAEERGCEAGTWVEVRRHGWEGRMEVGKGKFGSL